MSEYIEREKAIGCLEKLERNSHHNSVLWPDHVEECREALRSIPADDVRPVVLCRDCRHRDPEDHKCDSGEMERQGCPFKVADNYFCAYGER